MPSIVAPQTITLESSAHCQLRCPSCPTASGATRPALGAGHLRFTNFKNLLDANPSLTDVELSNYGEMFLNPALLDILSYAREKSVVLHADNGVNLNCAQPKVLEGLVKYAFRSMTVSIDGATHSTYSQYRAGGDFDRVIENIRTINRHKQHRSSGFPRLTWQFVVFGHNEHEIPLARAMVAELGIRFCTKHSWDDTFSPVRDRELVRIKTGCETITRDEFRAPKGHDYMRHICYQMWQQPTINFDGKYLGCCRNFWGDFDSNVFQDGLPVAVNSPRARHARAMLGGSVEPREDIPCSSCDLYINMQQARNWLSGEEVAAATRDPGIGLNILLRIAGRAESEFLLVLIEGEVSDAAAMEKAIINNRYRASRLHASADSSVWFDGLAPGRYSVCLVHDSVRHGDGGFDSCHGIDLEERPIAQEVVVDA